MGNPHTGIDFWVNVPPSDKQVEWKTSVLRSYALTASQTYDFTGTLFGNSVSERLLATLRIILMTDDEQSCYKNAFEKKILSVRNETAVYQFLKGAASRKLNSFSTLYV